MKYKTSELFLLAAVVFMLLSAALDWNPVLAGTAVGWLIVVTWIEMNA